ncbi:MAG: nicotinate phosphoribosyltransferase [Halothece sp.]
MSQPSLTVSTQDYSLLTDLYELTMGACYVGEGIADKPASFELFIRHLPDGYGYLMTMGLAQAIEYLEQLHFSSQQIQELQQLGIFDHAPAEFWSVLEGKVFTGDVWAMPEGTAAFPNEPLLRVEAPLWQAQLVETYLLNAINYQTLIATRAARMRDLAGETAKLLEFGTRRAFSPQGSLWAARAALAAGFNSTSNVAAALKLGEVPSGTMAHSLVMAIGALEGGEDDAFNAFNRYFPQAPLLIDTYDTVAAAERLASLPAEERRFTGVRLDSGDIAALSKKVRSLLPDTAIFASGDLDEWEMERLLVNGAIIDGYGIGTKLVTGTPMNGVYKLVEIDGMPTCKRSTSKETFPGRKQVFRRWQDGKIQGDRLGLMTDSPENGESPLLEKVMTQGESTMAVESLDTLRDRVRQATLSLPDAVRSIHDPDTISVQLSSQLDQLNRNY